MQIGMIGLGRMGANMVRRLLTGGHQCVVFDRSPKAVQELVEEKAVGSSSLADFVKKLDEAAGGLVDGSGGGRGQDYRRSPAPSRTRRHPHRRRQFLLRGRHPPCKRTRPKGIHYVDVGTSGGVWGLERGYCMMIGGENDGGQAPRSDLCQRWRLASERIPRTPGREKAGGTAEQGYLHCGPNGAGHFVKMVHNGIEYGIMAAYAEGMGILRSRQRRQAET